MINGDNDLATAYVCTWSSTLNLEFMLDGLDFLAITYVNMKNMRETTPTRRRNGCV
jgi:hypothetical protein